MAIFWVLLNHAANAVIQRLRHNAIAALLHLALLAERERIAADERDIVAAEAVPNSSTGSVRHHVSDNRLSLTQRVTPQKPLRSAGPAIQNDGSTPEG